ncbi:MAG TPA: hypothetical protein VFV07_01975 [Rhizomicrobium sp.]|nr:hypothetical protein [Rhizomicrobium sp.]
MMPPLLARLQIVRRNGRRLRLWLPLFLFWLVALPFMIVALPLVIVILALMGRRPFAVIAAYWRVLAAMSGIEIELNGRRSSVALHVY